MKEKFYNVRVDGAFLIRTDLEFANMLKAAFAEQNKNIEIEQI